MADIVTYMTLLTQHAAALPRFFAWLALLGALIVWASGRRNWAFAGASLALVAAALAIAGLPAKVHDPIVWAILLGGVFLGLGVGWLRSPVWHWGWALSVCVLATVFALYVFRLPGADAEALILIGLAGASVGDWVPRLGRTEARSA
jgi:hypothetical protein